MAGPALWSTRIVLYVLLVGQTRQACATSDSTASEPILTSWSIDYDQHLEEFDDDLEWGEWSRCSRTCGTGSQTRRRICRPGMEDLACDILMRHNSGRTDFTEKQLCNVGRCELGVDEDIDGLEWGEWSPCSRTCGVGSRARRRVCAHPSMKRHDCRHRMSAIDRTDLVDREACEDRPCEPVRGHWDSWSKWSPCSSTCGPTSSFQVRSRRCLALSTTERMWSSSSIPGEFCDTLSQRQISPCEHLPPCPQREGGHTDSKTTQHRGITANDLGDYSSFVSVDEYDFSSDDVEVPTESESWPEN